MLYIGWVSNRNVRKMTTEKKRSALVRDFSLYETMLYTADLIGAKDLKSIPAIMAMTDAELVEGAEKFKALLALEAY